MSNAWIAQLRGYGHSRLMRLWHIVECGSVEEVKRFIKSMGYICKLYNWVERSIS